MKKDTRFAHCDGITDIGFTSNGERIVTTGNDGDVRVWLGFDDDDPVSFSASDSCFGIAVSGEQVIVGTENNSVEAYDLKGKLLDGSKLKFTGAANHVDVSADGKFLVAGSADMTLQVIPMDKSSAPVKVDAHTGPVLSVAIDPLKEFIASSGCDGHVCVWSFENPKKLVKKWVQVFPSSNDITTSPTLCRMAWHPLMGKQLAVPSGDKVILYNKGTWEETKSLTSPKLTKLFSVVNFSNCGSYIGAGGSDGTMAIWDAFSFTLKAHIKELYHITGLIFTPITNQFLCTDSNGRLLCIKDFALGSDEVGDCQAEAAADNSEKVTEDDVFADGMDDLFDDDGENAFSISKIKADVGFVGDEYVGPSKARKMVGGTSKDDDDNDDSHSVSSVASSKMSRPAQPPAPAFNPFTVQQKPFQPSSTPEHLTHRFMVWNNVGIIRSYSTDDEEFNEDAIDIEFHDASFHHAIHLQNQADYHIGNMSSEVVVLACAKSSDSKSKLFCLNFASWDASRNGEWTIEFPSSEEVTGIALGQGWIAAATSENNLRLFSVSGIQKFPYSFAGTIVAVAGHENLLFLTYHNGVGLNGNQSMLYSILKLNSSCSKLTPLVQDSPLPLSRGSTLSWIGFSDEGTPVFSDSRNMLKILNGRLWSPFCDMREHLSGPNDHFWVVGVSETALHTRAVKCKSAKYPATLPRPTIMMLEAKFPLLEMDTEKSQLEDVMLQHFLVSATTKRMEKKGFDIEESKDEAEGKTKETLFKLFAMSCNNNRNFRASEYVSMMPTAHAMQLAMKYSSKLDRKALTERLQAVGRRKLDQEDQGEEEEFEDFEFSQVITHTEHRHLTSNGDSFAAFDQTSSFSATPNRGSPDVIILPTQENPLMRKQKDEIRSIISSNNSFRNPFKKDSKEGQGGAAGSSLSRMSSFSVSLNKSNSFTEDNTDSQPGLETGGLSKGMSKIDVWKKPSDKQAALPEFNPKDPNRKSLGNNAPPKKKNAFEKKGKEPKEAPAQSKKQRSVFEMLGKKSNGTAAAALNGTGTGSPSTSNPASPMPAHSPEPPEDILNDSPCANGNNSEIENSETVDSDGGSQEAQDVSERPFKGLGEKKRKRLDEIELNAVTESEKKSRISSDVPKKIIFTDV